MEVLLLYSDLTLFMSFHSGLLHFWQFYNKYQCYDIWWGLAFTTVITDVREPYEFTCIWLHSKSPPPKYLSNV